MSLTEIIFAIGLTIGGSFWGFYLNRILEKRYLPKMTKARQKTISGTWNGVYYQDKNDNRSEQEIPIIFELKAYPRIIKGKMFVDDINKYVFQVQGPFLLQ